VSSIQEKEIKEILVSTTGQRLLACMLLGQPLTGMELQQFPQLSFQLFDPLTPLNKPFPNVATTSKKNIKYPHFKPLFENKELYGENRIISKAISSGLIINVPAKKDWGKHWYYYLNPDIGFYIDSKGCSIKKDTTAIPKTIHHRIVDYRSKREIKFDEAINTHRAIDKKTSPMPSTIPKLFDLFWWLLRHPDLISMTISLYRSHYYDQEKMTKSSVHIQIDDLPSEWRCRRYLLNKGIDDGIFYTDGNDIYIDSWFEWLVEHKLLLYFVPSYAIYSCFSNYHEHAKRIAGKTSSTSLLKILTSDDYMIIPEKRPTVFTSLLLYSSLDASVKELRFMKRIKSYENVAIARNTQLAEQIIFNPKGPMYPYLNSKEIHFLLSDEKQYILPQEKG